MAYYWAVKYKKKYTPYSDEFETKLDAMRWYRDFGKRLSNMFDRELEFIEKK
jgi:hypothetical protein